jgi:glycosyltransferase involved in cell wall biosynthesis
LSEEITVADDSAGATALTVMQVVDDMGEGGAQQVVVDLSNWLTRARVGVSIFGAPGTATSRLSPAVRFIESDHSGFGAQTVALFRAVRTLRPDILHAHQRREALQALIVGRLLGIPVVEHAHTRLPSVRPRFLSFRSQAIFAVGQAVADMVVDEAGRPRDRVTVVGNAPAQRSGTTAPARPERPSALHVLAVGRLVEQKDPLRFVRVIARLARETPVAATWAGDGELRSAAQRLALDLGAPIDFVGHVDDVARRLDAADCLVMTSKWEGTPLAVLEAFDRERPVVATASAANGLLTSGRGFEVADDATDREFASIIARVSADADERSSATASAKLWVEAEASPQRVFGPVLEQYRALAGSTGP